MSLFSSNSLEKVLLFNRYSPIIAQSMRFVNIDGTFDQLRVQVTRFLFLFILTLILWCYWLLHTHYRSNNNYPTLTQVSKREVLSFSWSLVIHSIEIHCKYKMLVLKGNSNKQLSNGKHHHLNYSHCVFLSLGWFLSIGSEIKYLIKLIRLHFSEQVHFQMISPIVKDILRRTDATLKSIG